MALKTSDHRLLNSGDKWDAASGVPSDATVNSYNEFYIDTDNGDVYKKATGASSWTLQLNIDGADGAAGADGADGTIIAVQASAPSSPSTNDLWVDISGL